MSIIEKRDIYIAKWIKEDYDINDDATQVYDKPVKLSCVLNSLNSSFEIAAYGDKIKDMCKTFLDYDEWIGNIKVKDAAYLYGATPNDEILNGDNANYRVKAVMPQNKKILVYFESIIPNG